MYYLNKNDQIFKISQLTIWKNGSMTMYNDARYMYNKYKDNTNKNLLKVMNVIEVVQMLVDKKY